VDAVELNCGPQGFEDRLRASMDRHAPILDRLAENDQGGDRIEPMLALIRMIWMMQPTQRWGQALLNAVGNVDLYKLSNEEFYRLLSTYAGQTE
jgi:hypothetical protein